jgi:hypothetical protein
MAGKLLRCILVDKIENRITKWLFSSDIIITKFTFIFLGISGLSIIEVGTTILIKNVLGD